MEIVLQFFCCFRYRYFFKLGNKVNNATASAAYTKAIPKTIPFTNREVGIASLMNGTRDAIRESVMVGKTVATQNVTDAYCIFNSVICDHTATVWVQYPNLPFAQLQL